MFVKVVRLCFLYQPGASYKCALNVDGQIVTADATRTSASQLVCYPKLVCKYRLQLYALFLIVALSDFYLIIRMFFRTDFTVCWNVIQMPFSR